MPRPMADTGRRAYVRPIDFRHGRVDMTHGSGGRAMAQLIEELFARGLQRLRGRQRALCGRLRFSP